jgi:hypothetical protein
MNLQDVSNFLLQQPADQAYEWVHNALNDAQNVSQSLNWWLGLAEVASFRARGRSASDDSPNLPWAKIAIETYEYLIGKTKNKHGASLPYEQSMMLLRTYCIVKLGSVPGDPILDVNDIIQWFFQKKEMSFDEAQERAQDWRKGSLEEIRNLRYVKNRLSVIKYLVQNYPLETNKELDDWLALWEKLP